MRGIFWRFRTSGLFMFVGAWISIAVAQTPARLISPEVLPDQRVIFRLSAPKAQEVMLVLEGESKPMPMQKDEQGVWSFTAAAPMGPDYYGYNFMVDGVSVVDAANSAVRQNFLFHQSEAHVPGGTNAWEIKDVPHGIVHRHFYQSKVVGDQRDVYVYTPPGYESSRKNYPVLYLLHGFSDDASAWVAIGRANVIMDSLIAAGKVEPMLVVMPLGYGAPEILSQGFGGFFNVDEIRLRNFDRFTQNLREEVIPLVEWNYRVKAKRESRAVAGLSMGGAESLLTGLNHLDEFAWIGSFSGGGFKENFAEEFPGIENMGKMQPRLLWMACGTGDFLLDTNRKARAWFKSKGLQPVEVETPGAHTWLVWRRSLSDFAPLLFR